MFSEAPVAAVYSHPYVVALLPGHIEIRSLQDLAQQGLAQVGPLLCCSPVYNIHPLMGM